jgi:hypothetical protein
MAWILIGLVILAYAIGRASKPTHNVQLFSKKLEFVERQGYRLARFKVGPGLDDVLLALHRQEGIMQAVKDNSDDIKERVNDFGAQDEKDATQWPKAD